MVANGVIAGSYAFRQGLKAMPPRGLRPTEFIPLAQSNGLVAPLLPPPPSQGGGFTFNQLETLLQIHGPLWCAFGYGHIVVLKGAAFDVLYVHDPQGGANHQYAINAFNNLLSWDTPNCLMFLPGVPNAGAFG